MSVQPLVSWPKSSCWGKYIEGNEIWSQAWELPVHFTQNDRENICLLFKEFATYLRLYVHSPISKKREMQTCIYKFYVVCIAQIPKKENCYITEHIRDYFITDCWEMYLVSQLLEGRYMENISKLVISHNFIYRFNLSYTF